MIDLDYQSLATAPVSTAPFPHVVIPNFVPPDALRAVLAGLPDLARSGSYPPESVRLGADAKDLVEQLKGPRVRDLIAARFGLDLTDAPSMLTLRGRTSARDGRIHRDSTAKRVTALLYLYQEGAAGTDRSGCLRLLHGPDNLEDFAVEIPPANGTLLVFPNTPDAWHGHHRFVGRRYSMQLNYMTTSVKARAELRRHRWSAFLKRLSFTAISAGRFQLPPR